MKCVLKNKRLALYTQCYKSLHYMQNLGTVLINFANINTLFSIFSITFVCVWSLNVHGDYMSLTKAETNVSYFFFYYSFNFHSIIKKKKCLGSMSLLNVSLGKIMLNEKKKSNKKKISLKIRFSSERNTKCKKKYRISFFLFHHFYN